ncbi:MAG: Carbamoyltransferase HypF [Cyanobacteriota bacterium]|jgi:hydrogenase maturation protein HypF
MITEEIRVYGTVQGVGFRPTVYRLAQQFNLKGEVCNDGEGVLIRVSGTLDLIDAFVEKLQQNCPPLAKIDRIIRRKYQPVRPFDDLVITRSLTTKINTAIVADAATCPQCQEEILNPLSRWYLYPFTNCTHCGPRLSIIRNIPYDRVNTSMKKFIMCEACKKEYQDVSNRRFHAQPIACPDCGPEVWLEKADNPNILLKNIANFQTISRFIKKGFILGIKGIGGIHLVCDATNEKAVKTLRKRKKRYDKPLALMARDIFIIEEYCPVSETEKKLLNSPIAPIVLMKIKGNKKVASSVAPGQNTLGFMLPYTPLHHLILTDIDFPLVFTSGNFSDEPQCIDNEETRSKLHSIADYLLLHNREIVNRVDDSVMRVVNNKSQVLRRARGLAPSPLRLPPGFEKVPPLIAMGGELKNTFCLVKDGEAILSQHLGDLENPIAFQSYQDTLNLYLKLFQHQPGAIALDLHPEYLSTKLGKELAFANNLKIYHIQHHHAHIAACMAENNIPLDAKPVLGIALDGLGYGRDGTLWGGEFLLASYRDFQRLATFKPVHLIGGQQAIYQPWRNTYAHLITYFSWAELREKYQDLEMIKFLDQKPHQILHQMIQKGINSPLASSVGRLFDGVAAAMGICRENCSYEGQGAMEMEALVDEGILNNNEITGYPFTIVTTDKKKINPELYIDLQTFWLSLLEDLVQEVSHPMIAAKFHKGLGSTITSLAQQLCQENAIEQVVLTGGVFQNRILLEQVSQDLTQGGITVLTHHLVPANDGGISLGQAAIASAQLLDNV